MAKYRILSALTALIIASFSMMPMQTTYACEAVWNDFETSYNGWYGNADHVILTAQEGTGFQSAKAMQVSGRRSALDGAASAKGLYLSGGTEYDYSVMVYSDTAEEFSLSLLYIDEETGVETTTVLASENVNAGTWTKLSASFQAPEDTYEYLLTLTTDKKSAALALSALLAAQSVPFAPCTVNVADTDHRLVVTEKIFSGAAYTITCEHTGKLMTADMDGNALQRSAADQQRQEWLIVKVDDKYCRILTADDRYSMSGEKISNDSLYPVIRLWWDGDLFSESYNDGKIEKWDYKDKSVERLVSTWRVTDCTGSQRGAPMFYGDILGDGMEQPKVPDNAIIGK